ncbi:MULTISPECIES: phosphate/phosphite/phosphonate ABC transporter substrate-binding protein [Virgibacillus]|uniref:Phosphate-import protein PhnD n=1 Tax=Virgibacillus dokdonensis TaxID=302167 RepID=A0A2K9IVF2_9BACI|nr:MULTISPECIES: phosphate/phosphite/phosphonate ABC transporter substrate-binding protein [Virgibacillus]AUJ23354.1 Phosphate-import protein PhnD precursor [Virgibacillus dokdonensis]NWO12832.1 phosphate/phosphite/phosphonate ABC transporter substrate-binding protein [Virgibacillus sp.]
MKKAKYVGLSLLLSIGFLSACGDDADNAQAKKGEEKLDELSVQFVPSQNADTLEAKAKPLEELLSEELDIPVEVSVSTDYNTIIEAMDSEQVDVGFLPPTAYVLAQEKGSGDVMLQAQRYGVNDDGSPTEELVDSYNSIFIVNEDSDIESVEDLKGKKIGYQNVTSSAGFVWPAATLLEAGIHPLNDVEPVTLKGHDQAVISLLNGDIDAAVTFQDARNVVASDYEDVFEETRIIEFTEPIPNDTVAIRPEINDEMKKAITDAFIAIGKDEEGQQIIRDIYSHEGYVESQDSNFDIVREYEEKVSKEVEK